jgi:hypothetical protein
MRRLLLKCSSRNLPRKPSPRERPRPCDPRRLKRRSMLGIRAHMAVVVERTAVIQVLVLRY